MASTFRLQRKLYAAPIGFGTQVASTFRNAGAGMNPIASRAMIGAGVGAVGGALTSDGDNMGASMLKGAAIGGGLGAASGMYKNYNANLESGWTQRAANINAAKEGLAEGEKLSFGQAREAAGYKATSETKSPVLTGEGAVETQEMQEWRQKHNVPAKNPSSTGGANAPVEANTATGGGAKTETPAGGSSSTGGANAPVENPPAPKDPGSIIVNNNGRWTPLNQVPGYYNQAPTTNAKEALLKDTSTRDRLRAKYDQKHRAGSKAPAGGSGAREGYVPDHIVSDDGTITVAASDTSDIEGQRLFSRNTFRLQRLFSGNIRKTHRLSYIWN